jgi:hypothetical protein
MRGLDELFDALAKSRFRSRFRLGAKGSVYLGQKDIDVTLQHARDFISNRLAPTEPKKDGRQTLMRGHPGFIAQHATQSVAGLA